MGFGGGLGGWQISRSLGMLMATIALGSLFALVGGYMFATLAGMERDKNKDKDKVVVCASPACPAALTINQQLAPPAAAGPTVQPPPKASPFAPAKAH